MSQVRRAWSYFQIQVDNIYKLMDGYPAHVLFVLSWSIADPRKTKKYKILAS